MPVFHDVTLRTFADGDDMVGLAESTTELPGVDLRVNPVIVFRVAQENQVVDGDDALNATLADTDRKFARESVIELYAIMLKVVYNAMSAPECVFYGRKRCFLTGKTVFSY